MKNKIAKLSLIALTIFAILALSACEKMVTKIGWRESNVFTYHPYIETFLEESLTSERLIVLAEALEAYYLTYGTYPEELAALYEKGFIAQEELSHPWKIPYNYRRLMAQKERTTLGRLGEPAWQLAVPTLSGGQFSDR